MTYKVEEAATLVAYAVEDLGETEKTFGLVMSRFQLVILLMGVTTFPGAGGGIASRNQKNPIYVMPPEKKSYCQ